MLLTLGFVVVTLALVLVVVSASAVHIERKRLLALADAVAADAADAIDEATYYRTGAGTTDTSPTVVPLSEASVDAAVREYLATAPTALTGEFEALRVAEPTGTEDGRTARVTLSATVRPPLVPMVLDRWAGGFTVRVTSTARAG